MERGKVVSEGWFPASACTLVFVDLEVKTWVVFFFEKIPLLNIGEDEPMFDEF